MQVKYIWPRPKLVQLLPLAYGVAEICIAFVARVAGPKTDASRALLVIVIHGLAAGPIVFMALYWFPLRYSRHRTALRNCLNLINAGISGWIGNVNILPMASPIGFGIGAATGLFCAISAGGIAEVFGIKYLPNFRRFLTRRHCQICGYDRRGLGARACPECGNLIVLRDKQVNDQD